MGKRRKKRAPNGAGSIWRKPDGRYSAALTYSYHDPETGKTKRRRATTTRPDWGSAHRWLVQKQNELLGGAVMGGEDPLLSDFLAEWLREVVEPSVAPKTHEKREYHVRVHIAPALGSQRLSELEARRIHSLYTALARGKGGGEGLSLSTRRDIHTTLKMALNQAVRWGMLTKNPVDLVEPPRAGPVAEPEEEVRALTDEQARELFAATTEDRWRNYYVAAIRTGLRPGEMLGLQWGDLELSGDPGSLRVRQTLGIRPGRAKDGGGPYLKGPKSPASHRTLALHWEAVDALRAQDAMLAAEGLSTAPKSLVFPNTRGEPMSRHNLRYRHLRPALTRAGLPALSLHELRHTFASIALFEWRLPAEIVQQMLGHTSIKMTMDLYGHLMPGAQEQAIRALRQLHQRPRTGT